MITVQIAGNGTSRLSLTNEINGLSKTFNYPIYSCNLGYETLNYTKLFVIDEKMKSIINSKGISYEKIPYEMEFEPKEFNSNQPRNNTGMIAMQYAINSGYDRLLCYGFDFIIQNKEQKLSNIFDGKLGYEQETRCSYDDTFGRIRYLQYMIQKNPGVLFQFIFDRQYEIEPYFNSLKNFNVTSS